MGRLDSNDLLYFGLVALARKQARLEVHLASSPPLAYWRLFVPTECPVEYADWEPELILAGQVSVHISQSFRARGDVCKE